MLLYFFPKLKDNKIINNIINFLYSNLFIIFSVILMTFSSLFGFEIFIYYIIVIFALGILLLCDDTIPIIPLLCIGYMTFSTKNNPIDKTASFIYGSSFKINMIIIIVILSISFITRLIIDIYRKKNLKKPKFLLSITLLSLFLVLGGIGSDYYKGMSSIYGMLVGISFGFVYLFLHFTIDSKNLKLDYFARVFMYIGLGITIQIINMYYNAGFTNDVFDRGLLRTGWGIYNNVGCVMCVCLPAAFYLSIKNEKNLVYSIITHIIYIALIFTQSRAGILMGTFLYIICTILLIIFSNKKQILNHLVMLFAILITIGLISIINFNIIKNIFNSLFIAKFDDSSRFELYKGGWNAFKTNPIFGTGFYDYDHSYSVHFSKTSFLPPRYHNTIVQMIASCGILGLLSYLYHRFDTLLAICKKPSLEKTFIGLCISGILLTSLLDCHFFNIGPGIHYGVLLLLLEKTIELEKATTNE